MVAVGEVSLDVSLVTVVCLNVSLVAVACLDVCLDAYLVAVVCFGCLLGRVSGGSGGISDLTDLRETIY